MSGDDNNAMFRPVVAADVTDLALLPGEMRAFRAEMRDEIRSIASALQALVRIEQRLDVVIDRQNETDKAVADLARRVTALETKAPRTRRALPLKKRK